jgi:hypothetical protein
VCLGVTASRFGLCARGFVSAAGVFSLQIPAAAGLDTLDQHRFPGSGSPCGRGRRPPSVAATSSPDSCPNLFLKFFLAAGCGFDSDCLWIVAGEARLYF